MQRRHFHLLVALSLLKTQFALANPTERIGVLIVHGKNASNQAPYIAPLKDILEREGWLVEFPHFPWSRRRYLEGSWDQAMAEVASAVRKLQDRGATRIVLVGHSMGCPAAMSHAARGGTAHALVLLAPGHTPSRYYTVPRLRPVRESIDQARALVAAGKGDETQRFDDINQGRQQPVIATPKNFLSYFDPESDADMGVTAPRIPAGVPVLTAIGEEDPLFKHVREYFVDKLPPNPNSILLEVKGGHTDTPLEVSDQMVAWIKKAVAAR